MASSATTTNPVEGVVGAPTYGGLSGYFRPTVNTPVGISKTPTPFRGADNKPGQPISAPPIRTSFNRGDRGTNVTIPYARMVEWNALGDAGRLASGNVAFVSSVPIGGRDVHATERLVKMAGIDKLNRILGAHPLDVPAPQGHPYQKRHEEAQQRQWIPGETVLLVTSKEGCQLPESGDDATPPHFYRDRAVALNVVDGWRSVRVLREWCCDGIVLSNEEPAIASSIGSAHDAQIFNIAVQGRATVMNGYVDAQGQGMIDDRNITYAMKPPPDPAHRRYIDRSYHTAFPTQMFDRKLRNLVNLYVGIVATRVELNNDEEGNALRNKLIENALHAGRKNEADRLRINQYIGAQKEGDAPIVSLGYVDHFYRYEYVLFSERQLWQHENGGSAMTTDGVRDVDEANKLQEASGPGAIAGLEGRLEWRESTHYRPRHLATTAKHNGDIYSGINFDQVMGLVGAWRIGKVVDVAAQQRVPEGPGPTDRVEAVTVQVNVGFEDWRALRRRGNGFVGAWLGGTTVDDARMVELKDYSGKSLFEHLSSEKRGTLRSAAASHDACFDPHPELFVWPSRYETSVPGEMDKETATVLEWAPWNGVSKEKVKSFLTSWYLTYSKQLCNSFGLCANVHTWEEISKSLTAELKKGEGNLVMAWFNIHNRSSIPGLSASGGSLSTSSLAKYVNGGELAIARNESEFYRNAETMGFPMFELEGDEKTDFDAFRKSKQFDKQVSYKESSAIHDHDKRVGQLESQRSKRVLQEGDGVESSGTALGEGVSSVQVSAQGEAPPQKRARTGGAGSSVAAAAAVAIERPQSAPIVVETARSSSSNNNRISSEAGSSPAAAGTTAGTTAADASTAGATGAGIGIGSLFRAPNATAPAAATSGVDAMDLSFEAGADGADGADDAAPQPAPTAAPTAVEAAAQAAAARASPAAQGPRLTLAQRPKPGAATGARQVNRNRGAGSKR